MIRIMSYPYLIKEIGRHYILPNTNFSMTLCAINMILLESNTSIRRIFYFYIGLLEKKGPRQLILLVFVFLANLI